MKILHLKLVHPVVDPRDKVVRDLFATNEGSADGRGAVEITPSEDGFGFWLDFSEVAGRLWVPHGNVRGAYFGAEP